MGPLVEIHDATTASGAAALFGFVGLNRAQRMAVGEETLVRASVAQLARLFGDQAARPRATLIKDWAADLLTSTDADQSPEGHPVPSHGPWVSGAWAQRISLAGSETSITDPDTWRARSTLPSVLPTKHWRASDDRGGVLEPSDCCRLWRNGIVSDAP